MVKPLFLVVILATWHCASAARPHKTAILGHNHQEDPLFQTSLKFLMKHMPESDKEQLSPESVALNVQLAVQARARHSWARDVPEEIFLNNVLPYANLDEERDFTTWRPMFHALFSPLVAPAKSITEAAQILNRHIWSFWGIYFKPQQTPEIMSPTQTIRAGYASCTGLSIFLVNACRAVGIPARVAGNCMHGQHVFYLHAMFHESLQMG